jgi:AcrR family transcriptional regulator
MKKSEQTKKRILEKALHLFNTQGFEKTTTKTIAEHANISEATIFKYFQTKKNLLLQSIIHFLSDHDRIVQSILDIIETHQEQSIKEILKLIVYDRKEFFNTYFRFLTFILTEAKKHPEIIKIFEKTFINNLSQVGNKIIEHGKARGEIRPEVNNKLVLRNWVGSIFFMIMNHEIFTGFKTGMTFEQEIDATLDILLNGIRRPEHD